MLHLFILGIGVYGVNCWLHQGRNDMMIIAVIGLFFVPFLLLQWIVCFETFAKYPIYWFLLVIIPESYTWFVDRVAVWQNIWKFDYILIKQYFSQMVRIWCF